ncbi:MAG: subclass B1 metallo-beta-lactamase [Spirosomataceae bacterium]
MKAIFTTFLLIGINCCCVWGQQLQIEVTKLLPNFYVHTTYQLYNGKPFPSNGLIVRTTAGIVLVDTGWGTEQTEQLMQWIRKNLQEEVVLCIVTHAHDDRMGGISVLQKHGVKVISTPLTAQKTGKQGYSIPIGILPNDTTMRVGVTPIQTYFPGEGHTSDNIVVYFPDEKVLFGGCLIKSYMAMGIGNIADANLKAWGQSVKNVQRRFRETLVVIPGHEKWETLDSFSRTLELIEKNQKGN